MLKKQTDITPRIKQILAKNSTEQAIIRLNGYFKQYHWNEFLRETLGQLYLEKRNLRKAGVLLYFKKEKDEKELEAVNYFIDKLSNNKLNILKEVIGRSRGKVPRGVKGNIWFGINKLRIEIAEQGEELPTPIHIWLKYLKRIRRLEKNLANKNTPYSHNATIHVAQSTPDNPIQ